MLAVKVRLVAKVRVEYIKESDASDGDETELWTLLKNQQ